MDNMVNPGLYYSMRKTNCERQISPIFHIFSLVYVTIHNGPPFYEYNVRNTSLRELNNVHALHYQLHHRYVINGYNWGKPLTHCISQRYHIFWQVTNTPKIALAHSNIYHLCTLGTAPRFPCILTLARGIPRL